MPTLIETAQAAARAAGDIQKAHYGRHLHVDRHTRHDVKLQVDRLCEQAICDTVLGDWPAHAVFTEEAGRLGGQDGHRWIIDPLDGTVNFFYGLPYFCTSIACYLADGDLGAEHPFETDRPGARPESVFGRPRLGVVYVPPTDELFVAEPGRPATCNGQTIAADTVTDLADAMICTGFGARDGSGEQFVGRWGPLAAQVRKLRCLGAAVYDQCNVAAGRLSGFYEQGLRSWDIAAAVVIAGAAGCAVDVRQIEPNSWDVLVTAPGILDACNDLLASLRPEPAP